MNFIFRKILSPFGEFLLTLWQTITLAFFLLAVLVVRFTAWILIKIYFFPSFIGSIEERMISFLKYFSRKLSTGRMDGIDQLDLIGLSLKNMQTRKTRTIITIGGMTVGIAIIVFLVSVGYGLQNLVVGRVAKLDQMKQAEVSLHSGSKMKINDQTVSLVKSVGGVSEVLPLLSVVGKVNYNNSASDMVVYGVTSDYLNNSDLRVTQGEIFKSNEITNEQVSQVVPAEETAKNDQKISFSIKPDQWLKVRENSDRNSKILGYAKSNPEFIQGDEVEGGEYVDVDGSIKTTWIVASVPLWKKGVCSPSGCGDAAYTQMKGADGKQLIVTGSMANVGIEIREAVDNDDDSESNFGLAQNSSSSLNKVQSPREAVVNQAMLQILGIDESQAVGRQFSTSFVVVGNLLGDGVEKKESQKIQYVIKGVVAEGKNPLFYVPFIDIRALGVVSFSQLKVVASSQDVLPLIRKQIEASGYATSSVSDTVEQINNFFATARMILGLVGMVALFIASLGMFNTLTVSLLERTREVGLLKAMGMRSGEVRNLFLTESIIMSFLGGLLGVIAGIALGKLFSTIASVYSVSVGYEIVNITYVPWGLAFGIVAISLLVGFLTGIYPARRAQKISALNALRYE